MLRVHFLAIPFDCISFAGKISFANPNSAKFRFTIPEKTLNLGIYTVSNEYLCVHAYDPTSEKLSFDQNA